MSTIIHEVMDFGVDYGGDPAYFASDPPLAFPAFFASCISSAPQSVSAVLASTASVIQYTYIIILLNYLAKVP